MRYILLTPQPAPKQETAHYRPKTLGEMQQAFLNANNSRSWADDEVYSDLLPIPKSRVFRTMKQFKKALKLQTHLLKKRELERFYASLPTVPPPPRTRAEIDRVWNNMLSQMTHEDHRILLEELQIPPHILCSHLNLLTPLEEYELWKRMPKSLRNAADIATFMPCTEPIIRKHIFGTRLIVSFRLLMEEMEASHELAPDAVKLVEEFFPDDQTGRLRSDTSIDSRATAKSLTSVRTPLSLEEWYALRVQRYFREK